MIDVIKVTISGQQTTVEELDTIYSNSIKQYRVHFIFTDDYWISYNKMVVFDRVKNYDTPIGIHINKENSELVEIIDNKDFYCLIPWEVLTQPGYFNISIFGTNSENGVTQKTLMVKNKFTIQDGGNTTVYPRIPTPTAYEQLVKITTSTVESVNIAINDAAAAKQIATETKEYVNNSISEMEKQLKNRPTGYVFETEIELDNWLKEKENIANLVVGDNFYILEINTPDYWWDGTQKRVLETKIDLQDYLNKEDYLVIDCGMAE